MLCLALARGLVWLTVGTQRRGDTQKISSGQRQITRFGRILLTMLARFGLRLQI